MAVHLTAADCLDAIAYLNRTPINGNESDHHAQLKAKLHVTADTMSRERIVEEAGAKPGLVEVSGKAPPGK